MAPDADCPASWPFGRRDPLVSGLAIGDEEGTRSGTLGPLVRVGRSIAAIVSAHVVDPDGLVVQPPSSSRAIGRVVAAALDARMDAALVRLDGTRSVAGRARGLAILGVLDPIPPERLPLPVIVVGACSGPTLALVASVAFRGVVVDPDAGARTVRDHLRLVGDGEEASRRGDSGSVVVTRRGGLVVGVLRGGERAGDDDYAIATPIRRVLDAFGATLLTDEATPRRATSGTRAPRARRSERGGGTPRAGR